MNEYLFVYFASPNKYGNKVVVAHSKRGALGCFKLENTESIILNIIEL